jgi:AraC-like DNA-binding protein
MSLIALASGDPGLRRRVEAGLDRSWHDLLDAPGWGSAVRQVKERPVGLLLLDTSLLAPHGIGALVRFRRDFPGLPLAILVGRGCPKVLFEIGRNRVGHVGLVDVRGPTTTITKGLGRALERGTPAVVARALGGVLPRPELAVVRTSLEVTHRCWSADRVARSFGLSRPVLSDRLKKEGLPSIGHLMVWARLLLAGQWLTDPGRSGESVSRQLEYANGSAFRRALRNYVSVTPTTLAEGRGLSTVLEAFVLGHASAAVASRAWVA